MSANRGILHKYSKPGKVFLNFCGIIIRGYDSAARRTAEESKAIPYILLANQLICTAWFTEQEKYAELYEANRKMTQWLAEHFDALRLEA